MRAYRQMPDYKRLKAWIIEPANREPSVRSNSSALQDNRADRGVSCMFLLMFGISIRDDALNLWIIPLHLGSV